jgi:hypothetical protein
MAQFYYTYAYLREDRTPYYIGKGKGYRIYSTHRKVKLPKDKSRIIFLKQNLTEEEAFKHEIYMIAVFGRKDLGTGILRNLTDGGDGTSGFIVSNESRKKMGEASRKRQESMTPEQRSEATEQRSEAIRKGHASRTPEQRSEAVRKGQASMTPEQRSEIAKKRQANKTPEQRSEIAKKRQANKTPEQRSERARKAHASMTPEQRRERSRKASSQKFQCTVTGFITNAGGLSMYQRARGIDTSNRVRLS